MKKLGEIYRELDELRFIVREPAWRDNIIVRDSVYARIKCIAIHPAFTGSGLGALAEKAQKTGDLWDMAELENQVFLCRRHLYMVACEDGDFAFAAISQSTASTATWQARLVGICPSTINTWKKAGHLPSSPAAERYRIAASISGIVAEKFTPKGVRQWWDRATVHSRGLLPGGVSPRDMLAQEDALNILLSAA